jgi:hypothetical protein
MTPQDFKHKIDQKYHEAQQLSVDAEGYHITRGTAHGVSSYAEDLFAVYAAQIREDKDCNYFVDKSVTYRIAEGAKTKTCKPDLAIIDKGMLTHYYDLKMNLGFSRDLRPFMQQKEDLMKSLKTSDAWINKAKDNEVWGVTISPNLKYHIVVLYGWNISEQQMEANVQYAQQLEHVDFTILFTPDADNVAIDEDGFNKLYESLRPIKDQRTKD